MFNLLFVVVVVVVDAAGDQGQHEKNVYILKLKQI